MSFRSAADPLTDPPGWYPRVPRVPSFPRSRLLTSLNRHLARPPTTSSICSATATSRRRHHGDASITGWNSPGCRTGVVFTSSQRDFQVPPTPRLGAVCSVNHLLGQLLEVHMDPHRDRLYFLALDALISGGWCLSPSEDSKIPPAPDLGKRGNSTKRSEVKTRRALENSDVAC